jgi:WD40 repeat protein
MDRIIVLLVSCGLVACGTVTRGGEGKASPDVRDGKPIRADRHGDPLPDGVVARLGTPRLWLPDAVCFAFSPDAGLLAAVNSEGGVQRVHLCEVSTGKELWWADAPPRHGFSPFWSLLAFSPDGKVLALGCPKRNGGPQRQLPKATVWLWDVSTGRELHKLQSDVNPMVVVFDPVGRSLAVGGGGGTIELWDPSQGKLLRRLGNLPAVTGLAFTPDGKTLSALSPGPDDWRKQIFSSWDVATGRERMRKAVEIRGVIGGHMAPDGRCFATPNADGKSILLFDPTTGKEFCSTEGEAAGGDEVAFAGDGKLLTAASKDGIVRVWETAGGKRLCHFRGLSSGFGSPLCGYKFPRLLWLGCPALSRDGKLLALTRGDDEAVHIWDVARERELHSFPGHRSGPLAVTFLPDGRTVGTVGTRWADWSLRRWDAASGKELAVTWEDLGGELYLKVFSPDGSLAVTVIDDGTLRLWNVVTGKELRRWQVPTGVRSTTRGTLGTKEEPYPAISQPAFAPDGKVLLAAHRMTICRWEVATGKELPAFKVPPAYDEILRCFAAPDGQTLLLTARAAPPPGRAPLPRLLFLDAATGRVLREVQGAGTELPGCCAFAPDGRTLAVTEEGGVRLWEVASGQERGRLEVPSRLVTGLAFAPDGRLLAVAGGLPSALQLWDPVSGRVVGQLGQPPDGADSLAFSPDGTRLAVAGRANTALVCDVAALLRGPLPGGAKLSADELEGLWLDLAGADGPRAYRAIDRLAASPSDSVPFLRDRLKSPPTVDERRLARLIADLDADDFTVRDQATRALEGLGARAEAALRQALEGRPSPEGRARMERLLGKLNSGKVPPSAELIGLRVLEAMEHSDSALARPALTEVAADHRESRLAQEAKAALERLARRGAARP